MADLAMMREHFKSVRDWAVGCGEWSAQDAAEIGAEIKAAATDGDAGWLTWWSVYLAEYADVVALLARWERKGWRRVPVDAVEVAA
jgi:hypothetical protein